MRERLSYFYPLWPIRTACNVFQRQLFLCVKPTSKKALSIRLFLSSLSDSFISKGILISEQQLFLHHGPKSTLDCSRQVWTFLEIVHFFNCRRLYASAKVVLDFDIFVGWRFFQLERFVGEIGAHHGALLFLHAWKGSFFAYVMKCHYFHKSISSFIE